MSDLSDDLRALKIDRSQERKVRDPNANQTLKTVIWLAAIGGLIAAAYWVGVPYVKNRVQAQRVEVGEITMTSPASSQTLVTATGYIEARTTSKVGPKVAGRVVAVNVVQGQAVDAGATLYQLDVATEKASISQAAARARAARAQADTARANLAEVELQAKRAAALAADGVRPGSQADDLNARATALRKAVAAADATVAAAQADVGALGINLEAYTVTTPIKGVVVSKPPTPGENVAPGGLTSEVEITDFATLVAVVDVPENRVGNIAVGAPCEVVLDAFAAKRFRCKTAEVVPKVNRAKATVPVKVDFIDEHPGVLPDMAARVSFLDKALDAEAVKAPAQPIVPLAALVEQNGQSFVYVIDNGKANLTAIAVGAAMAGGKVVVSGPPVGSKVVLNPAKLRDGQSVKERLGND